MWHNIPIIQECFLKNLNEVFLDVQKFDSKVFPDFGRARRLRIISDYSGTDDRPNKTFAFLMIERSTAGDFVARTEKFKKRHGIKGKYFKYDDKSDLDVLKAEREFLEIVDSIRGVLVSFTIDNPRSFFRDIELLLNKFHNDTLREYQTEISRGTLRKQTHIVPFFAFIVIGFLRSDQAIQWISDQDEITDTDIKRAILKLIMEHFQLQNVENNIDIPEFVKLPQDFRENLVSVVDLMAGASSWYYRNAKKQGCKRLDKGFVKGPKYKSIERDEQLIGWMRNYKCNLKKLAFWISMDDENDKVTVLHVSPPTYSAFLDIARKHDMPDT
jgi:hypothetical protein